MEEVARGAGCSRTTLYAHFRNIEHLYATILEEDAETFIREAEQIVAAGGGAGQKIRRIVELTRATFARNHVLRLAFLGDREMSLELPAQAFTVDQERRITDLLRRVLEEGTAEGSLREIDPARVAYLMFQLGRGLVERELAGQSEYPFAELIELTDEIFAHGITEPTKRRSPQAGTAQ